jgi:flagellar biosynthesis/type III secretory pathway protein FliH
VIARARVIPAASSTPARTLLEASPEPSKARRRRIPRQEAQAREDAARIVGEATVRAEDIMARARAAASDAVATATSEARARLDAETTARWLALQAAERRRFDRDVEPLVPVAIALAERLLGAALDLDPSRIAGMARVVVAEAHGTRRAVVDAHPADAATLAGLLTAEGLDLDSIDVRPDEALARGDLRLHTGMGTIDARLHPRFEQLAAALRDALRAQSSGR